MIGLIMGIAFLFGSLLLFGSRHSASPLAAQFFLP